MRLCLTVLLVSILAGGCRRSTQSADVVGAYSAIGVRPTDGNDIATITLIRDGTCVIVALPVTWQADLGVKAGPLVSGTGTWTLDGDSGRIRLNMTDLNGAVQSSPKSVVVYTTKASSPPELEFKRDDGGVVRFRYFGELFPIKKPSTRRV